jgi:hypothetical protein
MGIPLNSDSVAEAPPSPASSVDIAGAGVDGIKGNLMAGLSEEPSVVKIGCSKNLSGK